LRAGGIAHLPDDLINLQHQVDSHKDELTDQTKIIKKLEQRVSVLEGDVKTLTALCQQIRLFCIVKYRAGEQEGRV
jgi:hypothetical protein